VLRHEPRQSAQPSQRTGGSTVGGGRHDGEEAFLPDGFTDLHPGNGIAAGSFENDNRVLDPLGLAQELDHVAEIELARDRDERRAAMRRYRYLCRPGGASEPKSA